MYVHVNQIRRHVQGEKCDWIPAGQEQPAIGLAQGVLQGAVADVSPVKKKILHPIVAAALAGMGDVSGQFYFPVGPFDPNQRVGQLAPKNRAIRSNGPSGTIGHRGVAVVGMVAANSNTCLSLCLSVKCTCGVASAIRVNASAT